MKDLEKTKITIELTYQNRVIDKRNTKIKFNGAMLLCRDFQPKPNGSVVFIIPERDFVFVTDEVEAISKATQMLYVLIEPNQRWITYKTRFFLNSAELMVSNFKCEIDAANLAYVEITVIPQQIEVIDNSSK